MRVWYNKANSSTRDAWKKSKIANDDKKRILSAYKWRIRVFIWKAEGVSIPHKRMLGSIFIQRIKINKNKEEAHRNNLVEEVVITKLGKVDPSHITPFGKNKENEFEWISKKNKI